MNLQLSHLIDLRKELHKNPELSDQEKQTALLIRKYISQYKPDKVVENLGGHGIAFIFNGKERGPAVMFRCELDALPIHEANHFDYRSSTYGVSHKCGHDGHMAIMSGLAEVIRNNPPKKGRILLLFQPSEENGQGAKRVLQDPRFEKIKPDYIFAMHNIPGYPKNSILIKDDVFSSASIGLIIRLKGKTSHASEPEKGQNPVFAMANILRKVEKYALPGINPEKIKIITPIYCRLGEQAFGTNPGYAELMFTIRATQKKDFEDVKKYVIESAQNSIQKVAPFNEFYMEHEWVEEFPNTQNNIICNSILLKAADQSGLLSEKLLFPFRWSEDFGHFLEKYPGALFGLGAGMDQPALHNPDYDFPDELIEAGVKMFYNIYQIMLR
ncbi:MAG: amidohydrolase [Bacteroidales bacterium]|nr:amidohydrolase [Bacteroidales bacterium]